ncbi:hypothetical protein FBU30_000997 [Linnemannia zychae]|nr:hypothetical protein FBU30_000997 [Linnemannia zychae]
MQFKFVLACVAFLASISATIAEGTGNNPGAVGESGDSQSFAAPEPEHKWWTWGDLKVGDCHESGGLLQLYRDGTLKFTARTWTEHSWTGDIWHATFIFKDTNGQEVFRVGPFDSEVMMPTKPHDFIINTRFEPFLYDRANQVTQYSRC